MSTSSLYTLPAELLYRIIDYLDRETIFFSLRYVCKHLKKIVTTYHRHQIDFRSISKPAFHIICHTIYSENIISLTLSDGDETPGQIALFISLFTLHQFTRLQSLTLIQVEDPNLNTFLTRINSCPLISLSIEYRKLGSPERTTIDLLSLTIAKASQLRNLKLKMGIYVTEKIQWPVQCTVERLIVDDCKFKQFFIFLRHLPNLKTLVMRNCTYVDEMLDATFDYIASLQLKSLTIEQNNMRMSAIMSFLRLTPSLVHLKLTSRANLSNSLCDGSQWEEFIQTYLPYLDKFEFLFCIDIVPQQLIQNMNELILAPFQTLFWLEHKHWFVTCHYTNNADSFNLFSVPICESTIPYESKLNELSLISTTMNTDTTSMMDNLYCLHLYLSGVLDVPTTEKHQRTSQHLFRKVVELRLGASSEWANGSVDYIATLIDLSYLKKLSLDLRFQKKFIVEVTTSIMDLLSRTHHIRSLEINYSTFLNLDMQYFMMICFKISGQLKHLKVGIRNVEDMKRILSQLVQLSTITFESLIDLSSVYKEVVEWLTKEKRDFTCREDKFSLSIWFGQTNDNL